MSKKLFKIGAAVCFLLAALTFFVPLISTSFPILEFEVGGSAKEILDMVHKAGKISEWGEMLFGSEEMEAVASALKAANFLYLPYGLAIIGAILVFGLKKNKGTIIGVAVGMGEILMFVSAVLFGGSKLEALLGDYIDEMEFSLWGSLGLGYWMFLALNLIAILLCVLYMCVEEKPVTVITNVEEEQPQPQLKSGTVFCVKGDFANSELPMPDGESLVIGRDAKQCNLIISGAKVSRRHCQITFFAKTGKYILIDFSSNGTFMEDGTRIQANTSVEIKPGTTIYLGNKENMFRIG